MQDDSDAARDPGIFAANHSYLWGYRYHKTDLTEFLEADVSKQYRGYGSSRLASRAVGVTPRG